LSALEHLVREEHGRLVASLARTTGGDLQLAEDVLHEAIIAAIEQWGDDVPHNIAGWLLRTARNKAIDQLRRRGTWQRKADQLRAEPQEHYVDPFMDDVIEDERLRLMCTCCHPALSLQAQVALTLKVVSGLSSEEVARAFLVDRTTMQQRIVRAKKKIRFAAIPYEVPPPSELSSRLSAIHRVIYLVFTEGWAATHGPELVRGELCDEAIRLAQVLVAQVPDDGETHGLLSLMWLMDSRRTTRIDNRGLPVLLPDQDRGRWDRRSIALGMAALGAAVRRGPPGPYTLQAAISSVHTRALTADQTDWHEIVALYDLLVQSTPSATVRLNRAAAVGMAFGPRRGLDQLDALGDEPALARSHLLRSARAAFLERLGHTDRAVDALQQALTLVGNGPERRWLQGQITRLLSTSDLAGDA
jgi:RNA polymerase sigma-70 factor (ECF subfamily)